jgi:hypothetical protein
MTKIKETEDKYEIAGVVHSLKGSAIDEETFKYFMIDVFKMNVKVQKILERDVNFNQYHDVYFLADNSDSAKLLYCENLFKELTVLPEPHTPHCNYGSIELALAINSIDSYDLENIKREMQAVNEDPGASSCSLEKLLRDYQIEFLKANASEESECRI